MLECRWSLIAGRLPGRTANDVKNFWNTHIQKNIRSIGAGLGGETENCTRTKIITKSNIIRPRPRTFSKLQVPGCSTIPEHQPSKRNNENPNDELQHSSSAVSLPRDQGTNDWTNSDPDECIRWWSNLLEISTHGQNGDETPFNFLF